MELLETVLYVALLPLQEAVFLCTKRRIEYVDSSFTNSQYLLTLVSKCLDCVSPNRATQLDHCYIMGQ